MVLNPGYRVPIPSKLGDKPNALGKKTTQEKDEQAQAQKETAQAPPQEEILVIKAIQSSKVKMQKERRAAYAAFEAILS